MSIVLQRIRSRAFFLFLTRDIPYAEARKLAAKEVAHAQKQRQRKDVRPADAGNPSTGIRAEFMRRLFEGLGRLREPPRHKPSCPVSRVEAPIQPVVKRVEPEPAPAPIIGVYTGNTTGAQLISDDEYAPTMRSPIYQNWKSSIAENERRARMRRSWIG